MIIKDQPSYFPDNVVVRVSSRDDGTMLDRARETIHAPDIESLRKKFCENQGLEYKNFVYQIITYGDQDSYDVIGEVTRPDNEGVHADALFTRTPGIGLFLPIADCVATVLYDPTQKILALLHLGRHSSIARLMTKMIEHLQNQGSNPNDLVIWMAPSVDQENYRLDYFDHKDEDEWRDFAVAKDDGIYLDLRGFNKNLAIQSGVKPENIYTSPINTATNSNYFSHSQGDVSGRFAVLAMIR